MALADFGRVWCSLCGRESAQEHEGLCPACVVQLAAMVEEQEEHDRWQRSGGTCFTKAGTARG